MPQSHLTVDEAAKLRHAVAGIKNIIYNAEQRPAAYTVEQLLVSMRRALGLRPDDKV